MLSSPLPILQVPLGPGGRSRQGWGISGRSFKAKLWSTPGVRVKAGVRSSGQRGRLGWAGLGVQAALRPVGFLPPRQPVLPPLRPAPSAEKLRTALAPACGGGTWTQSPVWTPQRLDRQSSGCGLPPAPPGPRQEVMLDTTRGQAWQCGFNIHICRYICTHS